MTFALLEAIRLLLELGDEPFDSDARERALIFRALQREIADAVGDDVDDLPLAPSCCTRYWNDTSG